MIFCTTVPRVSSATASGAVGYADDPHRACCGRRPSGSGARIACLVVHLRRGVAAVGRTATATRCIVDDHRQRDAGALVKRSTDSNLDMIDTTPSMFAQLHNAGLLDRAPLAVLALGGEALGAATWRMIQNCARTAMAFSCRLRDHGRNGRRRVAEHARPVVGRRLLHHPRLRHGLLAAAGARWRRRRAVSGGRPRLTRLPRLRPAETRRALPLSQTGAVANVPHRRCGAPPPDGGLGSSGVAQSRFPRRAGWCRGAQRPPCGARLP